MNVNKKIVVALMGMVAALLVATTSTAHADSISLRMPGAHWRADYGPGGTRVHGEVGSGGYRLRYDSYGGPYGGSPFIGPVGGYYAPPMGMMIGSYGPPLVPQGRTTFHPIVGALFDPQGVNDIRVVNNTPGPIRIQVLDPLYLGKRESDKIVGNNRTETISLRGPCVLMAIDDLSPYKIPIGQGSYVDRPGVLVVERGIPAPSMSCNPPTIISGQQQSPTTGLSPTLRAAIEDILDTFHRGIIPSQYQAQRLLRELQASGIELPQETIDLLVELAGF